MTRLALRLGFLLGWMFVAAAFVSAAAETAIGAQGLTSLYQVWYTLDPGGLVVFEIRVERHLGAAVWSGLVEPVLRVPGWVVFGVPGGLLLWVFRPHRHPDITAQEESVTLYDRLARMAREDGAEDDLPRWQDLEGREHEAEEDLRFRPRAVPDPLERYADEWTPASPDDDGPDRDGPDGSGKDRS